MALIRDIFLWAIVSLHVVGAAILFRRFFPRESPWFGYLIPAVALPLLLNFIEHFIALPSLLWLLPFTLIGFFYLVFRGDISWEGMRVPTAVFLVVFAFTFGIRAIDPDIHPSSDGLNDLNIVLNYSHGEKIPPTDGWMPTMDFRWYYSFQHYAASVVMRLLDVDLGTATNTAHALLSALTAMAGAAIAYRLSGGKTWVTFATVFLIEAAFTGSSAYIYLTMKNPDDWLTDNLGGGFNRHDGNPLWHLLGYDTGQFPHDDAGQPVRRELQVSGFWTWRDEYHANSSGHFFTLFSVFTGIELLRKEKADFPWICAVLIPPLVVIATLWLVIVDGILCVGALALALALGRRPENWKLIAYGVGAGLIALWPAFSDMASGPQGGSLTWNPPGLRTPFWEFVVQFWPVLLLWLFLCFIWNKLPVGVRWIHAVLPLFLIAIEFVNIEGDRYNTYEKLWGPIYSAALICFFPIVAINRNLLGRLLALIIFLCAFTSMAFRLHNHPIPLDAGAFKLQADGYLLADGQKKRIIQVLSQLHGSTVMTGHCVFAYNESPAVAVFTGNRCYIAWSFGEEHFGHAGESDVREKLNNAFFDGQCTDPLGFLTSNNIDAVVVWPGDRIPDSLVNTWKTKLAPTYQYEDCRQGGDQNAGVFLRRPLPVIQR